MAERVGLVVAGAGARGAYEAGALSVLLPRMVRTGWTPKVFVGTSAGAINALALAGLADLPAGDATRQLVELWSSVRLGEVVDVPCSVAGTSLTYAEQLMGLPKRLASLLDSSPQCATLHRLLPWEQLHRNIKDGRVDAVGIAATAAGTGGTVVFVERNASVPLPKTDTSRNIRYVDATLGVEHVLASAAIPLAFRPVEVTHPEAPGWYVDGGVRLNVPLKPAISLGCDHLGVVATGPATWAPAPPTLPAGPPDVFSVAALTLQALLADRMVEDLQTLQMVNHLVGQARASGATDLPRRSGNRGRGARSANREQYRCIDYLFAGPAAAEAHELGLLANDVFAREFAGLKGVRNPALWMLDRLIGGAAPDHGDLLSFLFFDSTFATAAAELGRRHASSRLAAVTSAADWLH